MCIRDSAEPWLALEKGVYVHYLHNEHDDPVHDRNGEKEGKGKLLVHPRRGTVKIGKFESGLLKRRSEDAHHMHRRSPTPTGNAGGAAHIFDPAPGTFADCLRFAFVLDLSSHDGQQVVRDAEASLRRQLDEFLAEQSVEVQDRLGDYRLLTRETAPPFVERLEHWARTALETVARAS